MLLLPLLPLQKGKRVRLCQDTSPSSCQEPLHPSALEAHDGRGRGSREVIKASLESSLPLLSLLFPPPPLWGSACPRYKSPSHPSFDEEDQGGVKTGKGIEIMFLVSHTEPEEG